MKNFVLSLGTAALVCLGAHSLTGCFVDPLDTQIGNCEVSAGIKVIEGSFIGNCRITGGDLVVRDGAEVTGNIIGSNGSAVTIEGNAKIIGNVDCDGCSALIVDTAEFTSNVTARNTPTVTIVNARITGNVVIENPTSCELKASVFGNLDAPDCTVTE